MDKTVEQELADCRRENVSLSQQVKRLIRSEARLYEYQQELDSQLKEYKGLYDLSRRLSSSLDIQAVFDQTVQYVIEFLGYERCVFFRRTGTATFRVCALDGYYDPALREEISNLTVASGAPCLSSLIASGEHLTCTASSADPNFSPCRERFHMDELFLYPLGHEEIPHAVLVVGNSAENAGFYRRVNDDPATMVSIGNLVGLISSLLDNHVFFERMVAAREQERIAEAKYRSLFENAAEGIFRRTPDGRFLDANPAHAQMLGYSSPQELVSQVTDIARQVYVDRKVFDELNRQLYAHGKVDGFEAQVHRKDGSVIWISLSMRAVRDIEGKVLLYEGMSEEITKRKVAEAALKESELKYRQLSEALEQRVKDAVDELRQKDRMLILQGRQAVMGEMLSNIAHQWRQPLNMLGLLVQDLLITRKGGELTDEYLEGNVAKSMDIIQQMSRTIDDFRYFFKPDREKLEFAVSDPLRRALDLLDGSLTMHGIRVDIDQAGEPLVKGYLGEFVQVILNILINARDALVSNRPPAPRIAIRLFTRDGKTVVSIADNAGGIPEEIMERIFEPYFTTKGPEKGTGIGLFMCKTIIEKNMGGSLTVRNNEDGAEFVIEL